MTVSQIWKVVNYATEQALGKTGVVVQDLSNLVSVGDEILSSDTSKDNFFNSLIDRIAIQVVDLRLFKANPSFLAKNEIEFGAVLQRLYVDMMDAEKNDSWDLVNGQDYSPFVQNKPTARQKLFSNLDTWQVTVTIPDVQVKTAFTSAEAMASFIDGIYLQLENSMELQLEAMNNLCLCNFMAEILNKKTDKPVQTRLLVTEYNTLTGTTVSSPLYDMGFLKYAVTEMTKQVKKMERMSQIFNLDSLARFTPREDNRCILATPFINAVQAYLQADTYHKDLVSLPKFVETVYWQGSGSSFEDSACMTIDIQPSSDPTQEIVQENIIGFMSDVEAMGTTIYNFRKPSQYNPRTETTNIFFKADIGYFNDLSHNAVVFLAE